MYLTLMSDHLYKYNKDLITYMTMQTALDNYVEVFHHVHPSIYYIGERGNAIIMYLCVCAYMHVTKYIELVSKINFSTLRTSITCLVLRDLELLN